MNQLFIHMEIAGEIVKHSARQRSRVLPAMVSGHDGLPFIRPSFAVRSIYPLSRGVDDLPTRKATDICVS